MYMYPVLREKESLIRKCFSTKQESFFQLQKPIYPYQLYLIQQMKENGMKDYSMYKYFIPISHLLLFPPKVEKKMENKIESKNDEMGIYDLFSMMSP